MGRRHKTDWVQHRFTPSRIIVESFGCWTPLAVQLHFIYDIKLFEDSHALLFDILVVFNCHLLFKQFLLVKHIDSTWRFERFLLL